VSTTKPDHTGPALFLTLLVLALFLVVVAGAAGRFDAHVVAEAAPAELPAEPTAAPSGAVDPTALPSEPATSDPATSAPTSDPTTSDPDPDAQIGDLRQPHGGTRVFDGRMLVAYYGTAGTGVLGVLGETEPEQALARLTRAAAPFARAGLPAQPVFELIVTVADAYPGRGRDYSHDIDAARVREYVAAAHRHGALLVLDLQPGRSDFLTVARRWEWALRKPWVGLALDPEWRMGGHQVPGRTIGSASAAEVNRTSAWLDRLTRTNGLPEKLFLLHQFRTTMIRDIGRIRPRPHLAEVQHVDGFGTPTQKLDTYAAVARPDLFRMEALLRRGRTPHVGARGQPDPAARGLRQLPVTSPYDQHGHRVRLEGGPAGAAATPPQATYAVVVDVLSFSTTVSVAMDLGATEYPYRWRDDRAATYARERDAGSPRTSTWSPSSTPATTCRCWPATRSCEGSESGARDPVHRAHERAQDDAGVHGGAVAERPVELRGRVDRAVAVRVPGCQRRGVPGGEGELVDLPPAAVEVGVAGLGLGDVPLCAAEGVDRVVRRVRGTGAGQVGRRGHGAVELPVDPEGRAADAGLRRGGDGQSGQDEGGGGEQHGAGHGGPPGAGPARFAGAPSSVLAESAGSHDRDLAVALPGPYAGPWARQAP